MPQATFRFYAELNDFLPPHRRRAFSYDFDRPASVKDAVEALGVPHTEIDLILVNGVSVDFGYALQDGDMVSVYPPFQTLPVTTLVRLHPTLPDEPRFVLDVHLGKLATYLRFLGFDTLYRNDYSDEELAAISSQDERILLTRDRGLLKRGVVRHGYYVRATHPQAQLLEVLRRFNLFAQVRPFRRCTQCNGLVRPVPKAAVLDRLLPKTRLYYHEFYQCESCGRVYWQGSHYERLQHWVERVRHADPS